MNQNAKDVLKTAMSNVIEKFAFMFAEPDNAKVIPKVNGEILYAEITFSGPRKGVIKVLASQGFCMELAANILGIEKNETTSQAAEDALKELINIVCGEVVAVLEGNKAVVNLSVPVIYMTDRSKWQELCAEEDSIMMTVEGMPVIANLIIN